MKVSPIIKYVGGAILAIGGAAMASNASRELRDNYNTKSSRFGFLVSDMFLGSVLDKIAWSNPVDEISSMIAGGEEDE